MSIRYPGRQISTTRKINPALDSGAHFSRRLGVWVLLPAVAVFMAGCIVSEADYNQAVIQRDHLKDEISKARQENQTLNQAILDAYTEREMLMKRISALEKGLAEITGLGEAEPDGSTISDEDNQTASAAIDQSEPVPSPDPPPLPPEPIEYEKAPIKKKRFYTASSGDHLSDVARRNGIPLERLKQLNRIKGDPVLPAGKKVRIQ